MLWALAMQTGLSFDNPIEFKAERIVVTESECRVVGSSIKDNSKVEINAGLNCIDKYEIGRIHKVIWAEAKLPYGCETLPEQCSPKKGRVGIGVEIKAQQTCLELAKDQQARNDCAIHSAQKAETELKTYVLEQMSLSDKSTKRALKKSQALFFKSLKSDLLLAFSTTKEASKIDSSIEKKAMAKEKKIRQRLKDLRTWLEDATNSQSAGVQ